MIEEPFHPEKLTAEKFIAISMLGTVITKHLKAPIAECYLPDDVKEVLDDIFTMAAYSGYDAAVKRIETKLFECKVDIPEFPYIEVKNN